MKVQVRHGVFETNSSSTHTLTVYNISEWREFEDGKVMLDNYNGGFITEEAAKTRFEEDCKRSPQYYTSGDEESFDDWKHDECIYTYSDYESEYEVLKEEIESAGVVAVSIYGYE